MKNRSYFSIILLPVFFAATVISFNTNKVTESRCYQETTLKQLMFDKITGTWLRESRRGFERWTKTEDGSFAVIACSVRGTDTIVNETVKIYPEKNRWVYEVLARGQNQGKAVKFHSVHLDEKSVQFSNPAHDFPTDINYTLVAADTLRAFIVGPNQKGGKDTIRFNFVRAN